MATTVVNALSNLLVLAVLRSPLEMALGSAHFGGYSGPVTPGKVVYTPAADGSECGTFPKCQS